MQKFAMKKNFTFANLPPTIVVFLTVALQLVVALPLYTDSRWIVNEDGNRVKLACVNWPSHLDSVLAEGLSKKPVDFISKKILSMGFNCVRFTWPVDLASNNSLASMTVENSFRSVGLHDSIPGIKANNLNFLNLTLMQAFQQVVRNLGDNKLMVILDNHISKPGWCCNNDDGNGFFGDQYFDTQLWIKGLSHMARMFKATKYVIGLSLRNELRGSKQNVKDWYRYMQQGAEAVHKANSDILIILSGLKYDTDFRFLSEKPVNISFNRKIVFEGHWYSFFDGKGWEKKNANDFCGRFLNHIDQKFGFLLQKGYPFFLSEFGVDQRGGNVRDDRHFNCMLGLLVDYDIDWAVWSLQGSYYKKEGMFDTEEVYGMLNADWSEVRNSSFLQRVHAVQPLFQGPGVLTMPNYTKMIHLSTGFCIQENLTLGSCIGNHSWIYNVDKNIRLAGTGLCLHAIGLGLPLMLVNVCSNSSSNSIWEPISKSRMHFSSRLKNGERVCMDVNQTGGIVSNPCKCLEKDHNCDPASQWFRMTTGCMHHPYVESHHILFTVVECLICLFGLVMLLLTVKYCITRRKAINVFSAQAAR